MATSPTDENLVKKRNSTTSSPSLETAEASPQLHSDILLATTSDKHDSDLSTTSSVELDSRPSNTPHSTTQVRQLFVGNLPFRVRWQDLKDLFRKAGQVLRADVALSFDNRSKGHGTVLFATIEDAQSAIDMLHNCKWHGRTLEVREDRGYFEQPFMKTSSSSSSASTSSLPTTRLGRRQQNIHQNHHQKHAPLNNKDDQRQDLTNLGPNSHLPRRDMTQPGRQLFVGNLPFHCQWQDVKDLFRGAGKILRADVAQEPGGKSRGFGTVLYTTFEDAENAIAMFDGYEYQGRQLRVHFDKFASGPSYQQHNYHQQQQQQQQQRQVQDYHLQQQPSRFGNLEFGQVTDPGVLENLKQTYGNVNTGGYAAFMMGQSPYMSTSTGATYAPSTDGIIAQTQSGYYMEPVSSGLPSISQLQQQPSQQQQKSVRPQQHSNYNMASPYFGYYPTSAQIVPVQSNSNGSYDQDVANQQHGSSFEVGDLVGSERISKQSSSSFFAYEQNPSFMSTSPYQWPRSPQEKQELQHQQPNIYLPPFQQQYLNMNQQDDIYDFYSYRHTQQNSNGGARGKDQNSTTTPTDTLNDDMQKLGLSGNNNNNNNNNNGSAGLANMGDSASRNGFGLNGQNNNSSSINGGAWDPLNGLKI
ncbi:hypothetical protein BCR42DRAFT_413994 [Absidia repens]|uniref:RRM domain-containing protein n=1 Tax=Absidia repens TaxID=90262 RepID=A0A1X2IK21_9FUNG|nr:hypothetical protein BCR42DRAFT_413994 [Absidia repens]